MDGSGLSDGYRDLWPARRHLANELRVVTLSWFALNLRAASWRGVAQLLGPSARTLPMQACNLGGTNACSWQLIYACDVTSFRSRNPHSDSDLDTGLGLGLLEQHLLSSWLLLN